MQVDIYQYARMPTRSGVFVVMSNNELSDMDGLISDINSRMKPLVLTRSAFVREAIAEKIARLRGKVELSDEADK